MSKLVTLFMYLLWVLTVIAVLAATFTDFKYEDLNAMAMVLTAFSLINSFFVLKRP